MFNNIWQIFKKSCFLYCIKTVILHKCIHLYLVTLAGKSIALNLYFYLVPEYFKDVFLLNNSLSQVCFAIFPMDKNIEQRIRLQFCIANGISCA